MDDSRFSENLACVSWFDDWERWVSQKKSTQIPAKELEKMFISKKLSFDLRSMVFGFQKYCEVLFHLFPGCEIKTNRTNQDNLEQFFGRQRAQNGQNNNPTESQYGNLCYTKIYLSPYIYIPCNFATAASFSSWNIVGKILYVHSVAL